MMTMNRILNLKDGYTDPEVRQKIADDFMEAARHLVDEQGAEVIIPAGGVAMALLAILDLHEVRPCAALGRIVHQQAAAIQTAGCRADC
jgi:uncharacterized protein YgbK (DUF1537 family)